GKKDGELKIEFADKNVVKFLPHGTSDVLAIVCSYKVEKERVKVEVTGFEGKEEAQKKVQEHLPIGTTFSFQWKVEGDAARLNDLKGKDVAKLKSHLEGEFERKK